MTILFIRKSLKEEIDRRKKIMIFILLFVTSMYETHSEPTKHILIWTNPSHFTYPTLKMGYKSFRENRCLYQNCYISKKFTHISKNVTNYDAILFNAVTLRMKPWIQLPRKRTVSQKYILVSSKSAGDYPITDRYNNFFHWTWTYKLDSDINNAYIVIKDLNNTIIGPKKDMNWIPVSKMKHTDKKIISKLQFKTTAVAWIVSNCDQLKQHDVFISKLKKELRKYDQKLDIFGECGDKQCPDDNIQKCYKLLETKYYFYLAFEDSMAEDYVTDQLLIALNHFTVPLVFGGANYSRFMPDGIYLDAVELRPANLARKIDDIVGNRKAYYDMFKWHNYYKYLSPLDDPSTNGICKLCALLNDRNRIKEIKLYDNIVKWFNDRKDWKIVDDNNNITVKPLKTVNHESIQTENNKVKVNKQNIEFATSNGLDKKGNNNSLTPIRFFGKSIEELPDNLTVDEKILNNFNSVGLNDVYQDIPSLDFPYAENSVKEKTQNDYIEVILSTEGKNLIDVMKQLEKEVAMQLTTEIFTIKPFQTKNDDSKIIFATEQNMEDDNIVKLESKNIEEVLRSLAITEKNHVTTISKKLYTSNSKGTSPFEVTDLDRAIEKINNTIQTTTITKQASQLELNNSHSETRDNLKQTEVKFVEKNSSEALLKLENESLKDEIRNLRSDKKKQKTSIINKNVEIKKENMTIDINVYKLDKNKNKLVDILIWTNPGDRTAYTKLGKMPFIESKCPIQNCMFSDRHSKTTQVINYDALIFNAVTLREDPLLGLPEERAENQKYILMSFESAANYPITAKYNNFFNLTWTYKLDSDIVFRYFVVRDVNGKIIGPDKDMHWIPIDKMDDATEEVIKRLQNKTTAVAWILQDCDAVRLHENLITDLRNELRKFNHVLNIFGQCGNMKCPNDDLEECYKLLESEYYFYLSFEDSMAEDYVTDQLLIPLKHFTVPVVFGGANYTRFMPDGIYLDALELGPAKLARKISEIIRKRKSYNDMFKWHNYYSYHDPFSPDANGICALCAALNNKELMSKSKVYRNIVKWFNDRKDWNVKEENKTGVIKKHEQRKKNIEQELGKKHLRKKDKHKIDVEDFEEDIMAIEDNDTDETKRKHSNEFTATDTDVIAVYDSDESNSKGAPKKVRVATYYTTRGLPDEYNADYDEPITNMDYTIIINKVKKRNRKSRKSKEIQLNTNKVDTSVRCPDIVTCFNTIVSNVKSKVNSLLQ